MLALKFLNSLLNHQFKQNKIITKQRLKTCFFQDLPSKIFYFDIVISNVDFSVKKIYDVPMDMKIQLNRRHSSELSGCPHVRCNQTGNATSKPLLIFSMINIIALKMPINLWPATFGNCGLSDIYCHCVQRKFVHLIK